MPSPAKRRDSLELRPKTARPGRKESADAAPAASRRRQTVTSAGSGVDLTEDSAVSHFSLATAVDLRELGASASGTSVALTPAEKLKGEKARSLLRMLLRNQKSSEDSVSFVSTDIHNLIPCGDVVGLLAVTVNHCKDFTPKSMIEGRDIIDITSFHPTSATSAAKVLNQFLLSQICERRLLSNKVLKVNVKRDTFLLIRISIDKIMKCTNPQVYKANMKNNKKTTIINFGDVRYFSVKVPKQKSDPRNRITLELVGFEGPGDFPRLFGNVTFHLYDVIQKQSFTEICAMRIRNMDFCTAEVELTFCYGCLGYGYSHQLKLPGADPAQAVAYSMFLRVPPPENRKDLATNVIKPQRMDYPAFLSPDLNVTVGNVEVDAPAEISEQYKSLQKALKQPPRERLERLKKEYRSLSTWREKADFLDQLILKRGPKTRPVQTKGSRFRELVGKIQIPRYGAAPLTEEVIIEEENIVQTQPDEIQADEMQPPEIQEWANVPHDISNSYLQSPEPSCEETESEGEPEIAKELSKSTENTQLIPPLAVTSSTTSSPRSSEGGDVLEDKETRRKICHGSETSLSSSSEIPVEFSETGDSDFPGRVVKEKRPGIVRKKSTLEHLAEPVQSKELFPRSDFPRRVSDEFVTPKIPDSVVPSEQQWPWKDNGFQEAVFSGNKFEPFLRRVCKVQPPAPSKGKTDEFSHLEETSSSDDMKEQEDQDPPHGVPFTKADSNLDTKLIRSGEQLSILRLIERKMDLEEEDQKIATQDEEEPVSRGITTSISQKSLRDKLSEAEIEQAQIYFKGSLEDLLIDKLVKVSVLESVLSKNIDNLVAERLSEAELFQEPEESDKEKRLPVERRPSSGEKFSETEIKKLKEVVSQNLQTRLVEKLSQQGIIPDMKLAEKDQKVSLPSAADLLKRRRSLSKERISQSESLLTIKPLNASQSGDISETDLVKETGLSASKLEDDREPTWSFKSQSSLVDRATSKTDLKKELSKQSLEIIRVTVPLSTDTDSNKQRLSNYDVLLEKVLKAEIISLKSFLNKKLQDHLKDKLAEIGVTPEDLKTVCQKLSFTQKGKQMITPGEVLQEDQLPSDEDRAEETPVLSKSVQNLLEALSEREMANLKSALNKKIQDHLSEKLSEIGVITEKELREILEDLFPVVAKETSSKGVIDSDLSQEGETTPPLTQNLQDRFSEEELQNLKSLLSKLLKEGHRDELSESEVKGLTSVLQKSFEGLPIQSSSETGINRVDIKDKSCSISLTKAAENLKANVVASDRGKDHSKESLHKISAADKKYGIRREKPDLAVNNIFEIETRNQETQTVLFPKKVKHSSKKESHRLPSYPDNPETSVLKKESLEAGLKTKPSSETLQTISEPFACSSFLSAHDIGVQTEIRNYLAKPNYLTKPSFPVNPQTFLLLHSESEDEAKVPCKYHQKPKSRKKSDRKRDSASHHAHQAMTNAQTRKEKISSGSSSNEVLKEKGKRHGEPSSPKLSLTENRKDSKTTVSPTGMRKESMKQKAERRRDHEVKHKKSTNKTAALSDPHLSKNLPVSGRTKGNTLVSADTDDIDIEAFKHLEKAIERALLDLGRIPDSGSLQGRPNTAPMAAAVLPRDSSRSFTSLIGTPRNQAGSISEMLHNHEHILKMTPEQLEIVLRILQKVLKQNRRPQDNE